MSFELTAAQDKAWSVIAGPAKHVMLAGGSRSGKTFLFCRAIAMRAIAAPGSRHAILRYRFNAVKRAVAQDTWPKMMKLCFPELECRINKDDWFAKIGDSEVWFGGLDDKERTEKILGQEYATIFFNECSQIPMSSINLAITRLAQVNMANIGGGAVRPLRLKFYYDENPPSEAHWSYKQFVRKLDPETMRPLPAVDNYAMMFINPEDNLANLPPDYLETLRSLPARMRRRFLEGKFSPAAVGALWTTEMIERQRRTDNLPDMQRVIIGVDPSGAGSTDDTQADAIGIVAAGLGVDGRAYVLEDSTIVAGPGAWGRMVVSCFDRQAADLVVGERNYGGAMVKFVVRAAKPDIPFKEVVASRGKAVRAEPIAALTEQDKVRFAGEFPELEEELCAMTTAGYTGEDSPNRADAAIWALTELFPGVLRAEQQQQQKDAVAAKKRAQYARNYSPGAWQT